MSSEADISAPPSPKKGIDWNTLLPELVGWSPPTTPNALAANLGRYAVAIGYLSVFWPEFTEYDGMVFSGDIIDEDGSKNIEKWLAALKGDKQAVESMLNHLHILDVQHPGLWSTATESQIIFIGLYLKEMWAAKLAQDFPTKHFIVELHEGTSDNLRDYQISFCQAPPNNNGKPITENS